MRAFLTMFSALWRYSRGRHLTVIAYVTFFIVGNIIWLFEPYAVGKILNSIQHLSGSPDDITRVWGYLSLLVALSVGFWLFHGPARVLERTTAFHVRRACKEHLFSIVTSLPMQWHKNNHSGQTMNRMSKATNALFNFSQNSYQLIEMIIRPIGALVALTIIMPAAAALAVGVILVSCGIVFLFDRVLFPLYNKVNESEHRVASVLHDYITNITTVITLRLETLTQTELWKRMSCYFPVYRREVRLNEAKWFTATLLISLMTAFVLGWYAWVTLSSGSSLLVGTFFMLYDYLQKIGGAFYTFAWKYGDTVEQSADFRSVSPILTADKAEYHAAYRLPKDWQKVTINHLRFMYDDEESQRHHLDDVSVTLSRARTIAFIGESGSGKSTLMTLIRGLHTAEAEVSCDSETLPHGMKHLASHVTLIPQEPEIFENTIEYNITLDTDQSADEVMEDVKLARFDTVISRLPRGLQTNTAEKGVNLSGGEKQRLALARGFFAAKDSSIILLDEPTSSVDPANERAIYENLFSHFSDRCIISSLHKLYLLPMFDEAYVFKDGKVIAHGTPNELLSEGGVLYPLWKRERETM